MFKKTGLDFKTSGVLNTLVSDYLNQDERLKPFYGFFPDEKGFAALLKSDPYTGFDRQALSKILLVQSALTANTSEPTLSNIRELEQDRVFTVTTGHQLCLFTGPLYFIYKIFSAINLAEHLKKKFPAYGFVPVYWMASEDHDFEEVNNFHALGKTITWKSAQGGAVGNFKTEELKKVFPLVQELFGRSENADQLSSLFENAYLKHKTLAEATRFLVNELFGAYGLITVDGDDPSFKGQFKEEFRKDIFDHSQFGLVKESSKELEALGYGAQVNARPINCFYLQEGFRTRIEQAGELYNLVGIKQSFTKQELSDIIEHSPEKISPNVVLRPLYQQVILPNLAYVGGPGELAYWLEFKKMFEASGALFPILAPRNFITVISKATQAKIEKLPFSLKDFFKPEQALIKELQIKKDSLFGLISETENLSQIYAGILERVSLLDKTLSGSASAELKRALNGFERISAKTNRAIRRNYETEIRQIRAVREHLFPKNIPQERYENFSALYLLFGKPFLDEIKERTDPFVFEKIIFTAE